MGTDFSCLCHLSIEVLQKVQIHVYILRKPPPAKGKIISESFSSQLERVRLRQWEMEVQSTSTKKSSIKTIWEVKRKEIENLRW